jgi:hypothetical protein
MGWDGVKEGGGIDTEIDADAEADAETEIEQRVGVFIFRVDAGCWVERDWIGCVMMRYSISTEEE